MSSKRRKKALKKARSQQRRKAEEEQEDAARDISYTTLITILICVVYHKLISLKRIKSKTEYHRVRKDLELDIFSTLNGNLFRSAYRMEKHTFYHLHGILEDDLEKEFFPKQGGTRCMNENPYLIKTKIRLSIALRYFAGASAIDLVTTHGVSYTSVFRSVWGVVDVVNNHPHLRIEFPDHTQQKSIAQGFKQMSGAQFDSVIGAIDGILIWVSKPTKAECRELKCGEKSFFCARKDKFGVNMQAICDNKLRFTWIDISWPGSTADYMAWVTSALYFKIESTKSAVHEAVIKAGYCIVGDNAYVKSSTMSVPFKGGITEAEDSYNFYQSQLRITIERTFGVLVHRWAILRGPLLVPIRKVGPLINCLCCLHNYCINRNIAMEEGYNENIAGLLEKDAQHLDGVVNYVNTNDSVCRGVRVSNQLGFINSECRPTNMIGGGEHFNDCPRQRVNDNDDDKCPMDKMYETIVANGLSRPLVKE
jgi:hypothetical protein